jgi:FixJ family two-component response regulator
VVFVVSSDAAVRRALVILLETEGLHARPFASTAAFLAEARDRPAARRCLLVEHHLPSGMDALGLLERLAAAGAAMPAIVLTETAGPELRRRAVASGATAVLAGPPDVDALLRAVADAI